MSGAFPTSTKQCIAKPLRRQTLREKRHVKMLVGHWLMIFVPYNLSVKPSCAGVCFYPFYNITINSLALVYSTWLLHKKNKSMD
jgi:hypothetical protein